MRDHLSVSCRQADVEQRWRVRPTDGAKGVTEGDYGIWVAKCFIQSRPSRQVQGAIAKMFLSKSLNERNKRRYLKWWKIFNVAWPWSWCKTCWNYTFHSWMTSSCQMGSKHGAARGRDEETCFFSCQSLLMGSSPLEWPLQICLLFIRGKTTTLSFSISH